MRVFRASAVAALAALISLAGTSLAIADGPVGPGTLPGGVVVNDSDPISGELWGRAAGRTIQYTVIAPGDFTSLTWGAVGTGAVTLAFDNNVNAPGETLTLDHGASNLANGVAVWMGQAVLPLDGFGSLNLPTRFILTVSGGLPLSVTPGGNEPGLDVLDAGGSFAVTLRFEAQHNGSFGIPAGWTPVLDLYDHPNLPTFPGNLPGTTGPVLTGFASGFFFDAVQGLDLSEHDANMFAQTNMIKSDLGFLTTEAVNRLAQLGTDHQGIQTQLNGNRQEVLEKLEQILLSIPEIPDFPTEIASPEDVDRVREELQKLLLILFGVAPCPPDAGDACPPDTHIKLFASPEELAMVKADVESLLGKVMDIQDTLEEQADMPEIDVQVIDVSHGGSGQFLRWLFSTTVNGKPADVTMVNAVAVSLHKEGPATTEDVTMFAVPTSLGPGLIDVMLPLPNELWDAEAFRFDFYFDDGATTALGSALVPGR